MDNLTYSGIPIETFEISREHIETIKEITDCDFTYPIGHPVDVILIDGTRIHCIIDHIYPDDNITLRPVSEIERL